MAMYRVPDHPVICNMGRTGHPEGREPALPHCPICGGVCETVYTVIGYGVIGCDLCVQSVDADECADCFQ